MNATRNQARGAFGPGAQGAAGRGLVLIAVAVIIGIVLLWQGLDDGDGGDVQAGGTDSAATDAGTDGAGDDGGDAAPADGGEDGTDTTDAGGGTDTPATDGGEDGTDTTQPSTATPRPPETVMVLVANGSGVQGAAGTVTDKLLAQNYNALDPANAEPTDTSKIYYRSGYDVDAQEIARIVGATPDLVQSMPDPVAVPENAQERVAQANVVVIIGSDNRIPLS